MYQIITAGSKEQPKAESPRMAAVWFAGEYYEPKSWKQMFKFFAFPIFVLHSSRTESELVKKHLGTEIGSVGSLVIMMQSGHQSPVLGHRRQSHLTSLTCINWS